MYWVTGASVAAAARALTNGSVLVVSLLAGGAWGDAGRPVTACAIPSELCPDGLDDPIWQAWIRRMRARGAQDLRAHVAVRGPGQPVTL